MKLSFEAWITILIIVSLILGTITSKSFWWIIRNKCKHCNGKKKIHFDDANGGFWENCEHCK